MLCNPINVAIRLRKMDLIVGDDKNLAVFVFSLLRFDVIIFVVQLKRCVVEHQLNHMLLTADGFRFVFNIKRISLNDKTASNSFTFIDGIKNDLYNIFSLQCSVIRLLFNLASRI